MMPTIAANNSTGAVMALLGAALFCAALCFAAPCLTLLWLAALALRLAVAAPARRCARVPALAGAAAGAAFSAAMGIRPLHPRARVRHACCKLNKAPPVR